MSEVDGPLISAQTNDREWDDLLQLCSHSHHEQSSGYAANRAQFGYEFDRVVVRHFGRTVAGTQVLVQRSPFGKIARILRGPIAISDDARLIDDVLVQLEQLASARRYGSIRVDLFPDQQVAFKALVKNGFVPTTAWYREKNSFIIPLAIPVEEQMNLMNKKVTYYVRRALRKDITVKRGDDDVLDDFYNMYLETSSYQGFPSFSREYFCYLWELFGTIGRSQYFVAYYGNEPIGAIYNVLVGRTMYYGWGGMRRDPTAKKQQVNYLLHIRAAQWAREHDCLVYDLSGDQEFKKQFAIETVRWPEPLWKFYGPAAKTRRTIMELTGRNQIYRRFPNRVTRWIGVDTRSQMPW